jgi:hypothetical protein
MKRRILVPKTAPDVTDVIFLAGPVAGTGGWQNDAIRYILQKHPSVHIAFPDYSGSLADDLKPLVLTSQIYNFKYQLDWEHYYLERAENPEHEGCILFWLSGQKIDMPISNETDYVRTYARDTRPELGAWGFGNLRHNPSAHVVIGGENGFDGIDIVRRNFAKYAPHVKFQNSLEDTCDDALKFC